MSDKIVVSLPDDSNEFQVLQVADARASAARLGLDVDVSHAANNAVQQIQQLFKFVHAADRPRVIVVEPVALDGMERVAQKAAAAGIGWAVLNCTAGFISGLRAQFPRLPIFALGSDQVEIGRMQGRQMRILLPAGGVALYIQGPLTASAAQERLKGMQEAIAGANIRTIVLDAQWTEESAEHAVRQWLRLKTSESVQIDLVAGQDDSMARGARRAVESLPALAKRWAEVPFLGIDGVPDVGQKLVNAGQLTATVVMPSNTGPALEALSGWQRSGAVPAAQLRVNVRSYPSENDLILRASSRKRSV
jgi:ABC-type sugar transport system substrate-binding protein